MNTPLGESNINTMRNNNNNNKILSTMKRENQEQWWKWRHSERKSSEVIASLAEWTRLRIRAQILDRTIKHRAFVFSWPFLSTKTLPTLSDNLPKSFGKNERLSQKLPKIWNSLWKKWSCETDFFFLTSWTESRKQCGQKTWGGVNISGVFNNLWAADWQQPVE